MQITHFSLNMGFETIGFNYFREIQRVTSGKQQVEENRTEIHVQKKFITFFKSLL